MSNKLNQIRINLSTYTLFPIFRICRETKSRVQKSQLLLSRYKGMVTSRLVISLVRFSACW